MNKRHKGKFCENETQFKNNFIEKLYAVAMSFPDNWLLRVSNFHENYYNG